MSAPLSLSVTTRTEALRRIISATATAVWEFSIWEEWADGEPRICDTDAAARLGYAKARDVRELIERTWPEGQRPKTRTVVRQQAVGRTGTGTRNFTVNEYWLTEAELLKLCARARTDAAEAILDEMIRVYMAVRRHMVETVPVRAHERSFPNATPKLPRATKELKTKDPAWPVLELPIAPRIHSELEWAAGQMGTTVDHLAHALMSGWARHIAAEHSVGITPGKDCQLLVTYVSDKAMKALCHGPAKGHAGAVTLASIRVANLLNTAAYAFCV